MSYKIKRRSKFFRFIKYAFIFIVCVTATVTLYYIIANQNNKISHKKSLPIEAKESAAINMSLKAQSPDLIGISLEHGPYYINAKEMQELSGHVSFIDPKVKLMLKHLDWFNLNSDKATLTTSDQHLQLFNNVRGNLNKQYYFESNQMEIFAQEAIIKSAEFIKVLTSEYNLTSQNGLLIDYNKQTAFFHGKIAAEVKAHKDKSVTNISSDKLEVFWQKKVGNFLGHVTITDNKQTATGEYGEYNVATSMLTLKDKVKLIKDGNILTGELLHYNLKTQQADLVNTSTNNNQRVRAVIIPKKKDDAN